MTRKPPVNSPVNHNGTYTARFRVCSGRQLQDVDHAGACIHQPMHRPFACAPQVGLWERSPTLLELCVMRSRRMDLHHSLSKLAPMPTTGATFAGWFRQGRATPQGPSTARGDFSANSPRSPAQLTENICGDYNVRYFFVWLEAQLRDLKVAPPGPPAKVSDAWSKCQALATCSGAQS